MEDTTPIRKNNLLGTAIVSLACRMEGTDIFMYICICMYLFITFENFFFNIFSYFLGYARTLQEISTVSGVDVQAINKIQSILAREVCIVSVWIVTYSNSCVGYTFIIM